jgi:HPt (histidine-containing phosphotransfer) domain-containing protein
MNPATTPTALAALPGLDAAHGLALLDGDIAAYLRLLRRYAHSHATDMTLLSERLTAGDREDARRLAHTLKGIAGNLGAFATQRLAAELEAAIKEGRQMAELKPLTEATDQELQRLSTAILATLPAEAAQDYAGEIDWPTVRRVVNELTEKLSASSMDANALFDQHAALLKAALGPQGEELAQRIGDYLYPEALETLQRAHSADAELSQAPTAQAGRT